MSGNPKIEQKRNITIRLTPAEFLHLQHIKQTNFYRTYTDAIRRLIGEDMQRKTADKPVATSGQ